MKDPGRPRLPDFISVIVTTYNREDALDAVLSALSAQTDRAFEIVIADDGSGPPTRDVVERCSALPSATFGNPMQDFALPKPAIARFSPAAASTASFLTAIASREATSLRIIGGLPSPVGSSPAIACCSLPR